MIIESSYKERKMLKLKKKSTGRKKLTLPTIRKKRTTESYFNQGLGTMGTFKMKKVK